MERSFLCTGLGKKCVPPEPRYQELGVQLCVAALQSLAVPGTCCMAWRVTATDTLLCSLSLLGRAGGWSPSADHDLIGLGGSRQAAGSSAEAPPPIWFEFLPPVFEGNQFHPSPVRLAHHSYLYFHSVYNSEGVMGDPHLGVCVYDMHAPGLEGPGGLLESTAMWGSGGGKGCPTNVLLCFHCFSLGLAADFWCSLCIINTEHRRAGRLWRCPLFPVPW